MKAEIITEQENGRTYTVQGSLGEYTRGRGSMYQGLWYLDSDHNIFPSEQACARFHGVGATAVANPRGFFSKALQKRMAACAIRCFDTALLNDDNRLAAMLGKYDELFNDYMLKGVRATMMVGPDGNEEIRVYRRVTLPDGVTKVWSPCYESAEPVNEERRYYYFRLTDGERDALRWEMEIACGNMGKAREQIKYRPFMATLTEDELKKFREVADYVLDDYSTYPYVNSRMLAQELPVIRRFLEWMDGRDMMGENWDLAGAYGKICR